MAQACELKLFKAKSPLTEEGIFLSSYYYHFFHLHLYQELTEKLFPGIEALIIVKAEFQ